MIRISKSFYEVKTGFGENTNYTYGIRFVYTKRLCEQKIYDFSVYMPFNFEIATCYHLKFLGKSCE